ncbi:flagellar hook-associated protein FlgL [Paenibacillus hexagrammi]|uniref:Flagellar hook-associated protein FlgL n=1 Tax=Paenibacillus hexagrammi TaxID=2908839 RepID=A0ABY3SGR4_9BACL|nr:flagellar hook-associated protein FlgL [Paenibacillus sp. YPD9-1]UJF33228.1 flagellar hook-associated protein FlgL [Paenibacillus sp. YPD9-1]
MSLRVTQSMTTTQMLGNLNNNLIRMNAMQNQLSTGRKINKPSDDPVGITYSLRYRGELNANEQYTKNVDSASSWLDNSDTVLDSANTVLQRIRELAVQGSNSSNDQTALNSIKNEVGELYSQLVDVGNTKFNGKYILNGQKTDVQPYSKVDLTDTSGAAKAYTNNTDTGEIPFELGSGTTIPINITGSEALGSSTDDDNAFKIIQDLYDALGAGNTTGVSATLDRIDTRMNKILESRSQVGARTNRVDLIKNRLSDTNTNLETLKSNAEDANMSEVIINLQTSENVYQASLSTGSKLIQSSLVDYLK